MKKILLAVLATLIIAGCINNLTANEFENSIGGDLKNLYKEQSSSVKSYSFKSGDTIDLDIIAEVAGLKKEDVVKGTCAANKDEDGNVLIEGCGGRLFTFIEDLNIFVGIDCGLSGGKTICSIDLCKTKESGCAISQKTWETLE